MTYIVAHAGSGIYGEGRTIEDAKADFETALVEFRDVLRKPPPLSPRMAKLLADLEAGRIRWDTIQIRWDTIQSETTYPVKVPQP